MGLPYCQCQGVYKGQVTCFLRTSFTFTMSDNTAVTSSYETVGIPCFSGSNASIGGSKILREITPSQSINDTESEVPGPILLAVFVAPKLYTSPTCNRDIGKDPT